MTGAVALQPVPTPGATVTCGHRTTGVAVPASTAEPGPGLVAS